MDPILRNLTNKDLNRKLTDEEFKAVNWWVTKIIGGKHYHNAMRSIISSGNIKGILKDFREHAGDSEYEKEKRAGFAYRQEIIKKFIKNKVMKSQRMPTAIETGLNRRSMEEMKKQKAEIMKFIRLKQEIIRTYGS